MPLGPGASRALPLVPALELPASETAQIHGHGQQGLPPGGRDLETIESEYSPATGALP